MNFYPRLRLSSFCPPTRRRHDARQHLLHHYPSSLVHHLRGPCSLFRIYSTLLFPSSYRITRLTNQFPPLSLCLVSRNTCMFYNRLRTFYRLQQFFYHYQLPHHSYRSFSLSASHFMAFLFFSFLLLSAICFFVGSLSTSYLSAQSILLPP